MLFADVLEHLNHPIQAIGNIRKTLRIGGHLLMTMPTLLRHTMNLSLNYVLRLLSGNDLLEHHKLSTSDLWCLSWKALTSFFGTMDSFQSDL